MRKDLKDLVSRFGSMQAFITNYTTDLCLISYFHFTFKALSKCLLYTPLIVDKCVFEGLLWEMSSQPCRLKKGCWFHWQQREYSKTHVLVSAMMKTRQRVFWQAGSAHDATHSETCCPWLQLNAAYLEEWLAKARGSSEDISTGCERSEEPWDSSSCDRLHGHILQVDAWRWSCDICARVKSNTPDLIIPALEKRLKQSAPCF